MVGVPALGIGSMWELPLSKKREHLGTCRVDVGGPTGSYGEEEGLEEDEGELAGKAPSLHCHEYGQYHDLVSS